MVGLTDLITTIIYWCVFTWKTSYKVMQAVKTALSGNDNQTLIRRDLKSNGVEKYVGNLSVDVNGGM